MTFKLGGQPICDGNKSLHEEASHQAIPKDSRTPTGFLVAGPTKYDRRSPIWIIGEALVQVSTGKVFYPCRNCFETPSQKMYLKELTNTLQMLRHLESHGYDRKGHKVENPHKRKATDQSDMQ